MSCARRSGRSREKEIAPYAADVDENERFPQEALDALNAAGFNAVHMPEAVRRPGRRLGGHLHRDRGGRAGVRSSSLIPAVNKLGTMGADPARAPRSSSRRCCRPSPNGEAMVSYALSEREAGSDAAAMRTRAQRDGDDWVLNGTKCWITNGGQVDLVHGDGRDRPGQGRQRDLRVHGAQGRSGVRRRAQGEEAGHQGLADRTSCTSRTAASPRDRIIGEPGTGFKTALETLDHTRPTIGAQAVGIAQGALDAAVAYTKDRKQFGKPIVDLPGRAVHARRHGDEDRGRAAPGLHRRRPRRTRRARTSASSPRRRSASRPTSRWR